MGSKKGRGGEALTEPAQPPRDSHSEFSNLSSINKVSFLEGLQKHDDKPLHSTALEEDLHVFEEGQAYNRNPGRNERCQTTTEMRGAAVRREKTRGETETEEKRSQTSDVSTLNGRRKKPAKLRGGQTSAVRPVEKKQMKRSKLTRGRSSDSQKRRKVSSSEEEEHEDSSWCPSPQKAKLSRTRKSSVDRAKTPKSSSGEDPRSTSADAEEANVSDHQGWRGPRGETDLDLVLAAFLDFCDKYRASVESKAVKQSIDSFSNNVKDQLLKKISSYKEFRFLKRENAKVGSLICRKTQRLLDARNELMRAQRQVRLLQTEKAELELRLADLRRGYTFLHDIRELNRQYLRYRHTHHRENETYGVSSNPATLLEQRQKGINQETEN